MKAHRTDLVSFAFGLLFLGLSVWWLLAQILGLSLPPVGWFLAGALVLIGLLGLVGALRSARTADRDAAARTDAATSPAAAPTSAAPVSAAPTSAAPVSAGPADGDAVWSTGVKPTDRFGTAEPDRFGAEPGPFGRADDRTGWRDTAELHLAGSETSTAPVWGSDDAATRTPDDPYRSATGADEWPTEAVGDRPVGAVEDRAADAPGRSSDEGADDRRPASGPAPGQPAGEQRSAG